VTGFARAQAAYDRMEPPEYLECEDEGCLAYHNTPCMVCDDPHLGGHGECGCRCHFDPEDDPDRKHDERYD
jgi:hypothetical protein